MAVSIRCPACDQRLVAADGDVLSAALAIHFARDHGLLLPDPENVRGGEEGNVSSEAETSGIAGTGTAFEGEMPSGSSAYGAGITQRGDALYGTEGPPYNMDEYKIARYEIECPLCGLIVVGRNEDDLTERYCGHLLDTKEICSLRNVTVEGVSR